MSVQSLDLTKPNWMLRVVTDNSKEKGIDVKRDTERIDQIKAIKNAWEMAEPGRSAKVTLLIQYILSSFGIYNVLYFFFFFLSGLHWNIRHRQNDLLCLAFRLFSLVSIFLNKCSKKSVVMLLQRKTKILVWIFSKWTHIYVNSYGVR